MLSEYQFLLHNISRFFPFSFRSSLLCIHESKMDSFTQGFSAYIYKSAIQFGIGVNVDSEFTSS